MWLHNVKGQTANLFSWQKNILLELSNKDARNRFVGARR
jgi:hypothetical protein